MEPTNGDAHDLDIGGNVSDSDLVLGQGNRQTRTDERSPVQNIYNPERVDKSDWPNWVAYLQVDLVRIQTGLERDLGAISTELKTQDRHLSKMAGDVAELKGLRHTVNELRHTVGELERRMRQVTEMENDIRSEMDGKVTNLERSVGMQLAVSWIFQAILFVGMVIALIAAFWR